MHEMTLGVDLSDAIVRLALVDTSGQVVSRVEAPAGASASGIRDAARRAIAGARGGVGGIGVALPAAGEDVPTDITLALREASSRETDIVSIPAGTAAAVAEH